MKLQYCFHLERVEMAAARTSKRPLLPPKPAKLLQVNGLPRLASNRDSILPTSITPETQRSLDVIFSFDTEANESRIAEVWPRRCSFIVKEILHTERNYVESLGEVIKVHQRWVYCPQWKLLEFGLWLSWLLDGCCGCVTHNYSTGCILQTMIDIVLSCVYMSHRISCMDVHVMYLTQIR